MVETWEQTKMRFYKALGIGATTEPPIVPVVKEHKRQPVQEVTLYNVHKRSLPVGIDNIVLFSVSKKEAHWWIENKLRTRAYQDDTSDSKTVIYYDIIPVGAKPKERSVYYNPLPVCNEAFPDFKTPRRVN